jgi:hypothetical protein
LVAICFPTYRTVFPNRSMKVFLCSAEIPLTSLSLQKYDLIFLHVFVLVLLCSALDVHTSWNSFSQARRLYQMGPAWAPNNLSSPTRISFHPLKIFSLSNASSVPSVFILITENNLWKFLNCSVANGTFRKLRTFEFKIVSDRLTFKILDSVLSYHFI